jgi:hypothetical protein
MTDHYIDGDGAYRLGDAVTLLTTVLRENAKMSQDLKLILMRRDCHEITTREAFEELVAVLDAHDAARQAAHHEFLGVRV